MKLPAWFLKNLIQNFFISCLYSGYFEVKIQNAVSTQLKTYINLSQPLDVVYGILGHPLSDITKVSMNFCLWEEKVVFNSFFWKS